MEISKSTEEAVQADRSLSGAVLDALRHETEERPWLRIGQLIALAVGERDLFSISNEDLCDRLASWEAQKRERASQFFERGLTRPEPPWDELDDGIREAVRWFWLRGWDTTDSGDGSKFGVMECASEVPHVYMMYSPPEGAIHAARGLACEVPDDVVVEVSYSATEGGAFITAYGNGLLNMERHWDKLWKK